MKNNYIVSKENGKVVFQFANYDVIINKTTPREDGTMLDIDYSCPYELYQDQLEELQVCFLDFIQDAVDEAVKE